VTQALPIAAPSRSEQLGSPPRGSPVTAAAWLGTAFCVSLLVTVQSLHHGDEWWHLALGQLILNGGIPASEPFSFVATQHPWVDPQWLLEGLLALLVKAGGDGLASLVLGLAGSLALLLAALAVPKAARVPPGWRAAAMLLGGVTGGVAMGVGGQTITALGVAATLLILRRWRDGSRRAVWLLPPLYLLWANLDPAFVAGLLILACTLLIHRATGGRRGAPAWSPATSLAVIGVGAAAATVLGSLGLGVAALVLLWAAFRPVPVEPGSRRRSLLLASALAALVTLANPAGPGLYGYVAETLGNPMLSQLLAGWQSPNFHDMVTRLIEIVAGLLPLCWLLARRVRVPDALLATALFLVTLQAVGAVSLFALAAIPQLAEYGWAAWHQRAPGGLQRRLGVRVAPPVAVAVAVALSGVSLAVVVPRTSSAAAVRFESANEPRAAAAYVALHFPGQRLLSSDSDASYLAYRFPSQRVVFVYDEIGIFGTGPLTDYHNLANLSGDWKGLLVTYHLNHAVLSATSVDAAALLELGWTVDCYDAASDRVVMSAGGGPPTASPPAPREAASCSS